jgi:signal transduction histidine kinase
MISTTIRNLISNAIKFTNKNWNIEVSSTEEEKYLRISIKDNWVGMDKDRIKKLFEVEEKNTTLWTEREKWTWLGLLLCKEFIEKNWWKIRVESEVWKWTAFHFTIPKTLEIS